MVVFTYYTYVPQTVYMHYYTLILVQAYTQLALGKPRTLAIVFTGGSILPM